MSSKDQQSLTLSHATLASDWLYRQFSWRYNIAKTITWRMNHHSAQSGHGYPQGWLIKLRSLLKKICCCCLFRALSSWPLVLSRTTITDLVNIIYCEKTNQKKRLLIYFTCKKIPGCSHISSRIGLVLLSVILYNICLLLWQSPWLTVEEPGQIFVVV